MNATIHTLTPDLYEIAAGWCIRLADGPMSEVDRQDFDRWLDADPSHREIFQEVAEGWDLIETLSATPEMMSFRQAAMATARKAHQNRWISLPRRHRGAAFALAASVVLSVGIGLTWLSQQPVVYETGVGEREVVRLADGSSISLDGDTEVRVRYANNQRRLWLDRGRARFNVAKDPLRPFSVDASGRVVVATGTSFSVERVSGQVRVVLYEGKVAVLEKDSSAAPGGRPQTTTTDRTLNVNEEMVIANQGSVAAAPIVPADPVRTATWEGGILTFEADTLVAAAERMNRYSDKPIEVAPTAANLRISGVFRAGDTAAFVEGATAILPVSASRRDGVTVLAATAPH